MQNYTLSDLHEMDASFKHTTMLKLFLTGFVIYTIGYTMSVTTSAIFIICDLMRLIGIGLIIISSIQMISLRFENKYLKIMYTFYLLWLFIVVLRGFTFNYEFIKNALFDPGAGFFLYSVPLILLIPKPPKFYKLIFFTALVLGLFYLIHMALGASEFLDLKNDSSRDRFEVFVKILALPCGFLLMTFNYQPKKNQALAFIVISITILLALYRARRGLIFMSGSVFIFTFLIFIYLNKRKVLLMLFSILTGSLLLGYSATMLNVGDSKLLSKTTERGTEDTRSGVEDFYYADMQFKDWMIGRGMSGMVAAPIGIDVNSKTPGYRTGIETDYLNIILKGGILSLGLLLLIAIPAVIQGLFLSKNILSKAAALWIVLWLISLYPSTVTTFSLNYILVWIAIGICYSKSVRNMSDDVLKAYFLYR
jgi:hypothetical protein